MPTIPEVRHYRLVQWELSSRVQNERLVEDEEYTIPDIDEREYRYECSVPSCRSLWDLRMTPSGIFCAAHYLPWLHRDSNGNIITLSHCEAEGCFEPRVSKRKLCRMHSIGEIPDEEVARWVEILMILNRDDPEILGGQIVTYQERNTLQAEV